jgi:TRAP-type C4-dicarboxylate transport system substrate-binding protein
MGKKEWLQSLVFHQLGLLPLFSKKPLTQVSELKGMRIRGYGVGAETVDRMGGRGMPIVAAEVYQSLERGILDGSLLSVTSPPRR